MFVMQDEQLHRLFEINDEKEFKKAVLRELLPRWRALHPKPPRKTPGPIRLPEREVWAATKSVLEKMTKRQLQSLGWRDLIAKVQASFTKPKTSSLYSEATIRKHVRSYIYLNSRIDEIPPRLLDRRQFPIPPGTKTLDALREFICSFYFTKLGFQVFKLSDTFSDDFDLPYRAGTTKKS